MPVDGSPPSTDVVVNATNPIAHNVLKRVRHTLKCLGHYALKNNPQSTPFFCCCTNLSIEFMMGVS